MWLVSLLSHFKDEETEAQIYQETCPRSHMQVGGGVRIQTQAVSVHFFPVLPLTSKTTRSHKHVLWGQVSMHPELKQVPKTVKSFLVVHVAHSGF